MMQALLAPLAGAGGVQGRDSADEQKNEAGMLLLITGCSRIRRKTHLMYGLSRMSCRDRSIAYQIQFDEKARQPPMRNTGSWSENVYLYPAKDLAVLPCGH